MTEPTAAPEREADVLRRAVQIIIDRLPPAWATTLTEDAVIGDPSRRVDAVLELQSPDGSRAALVIEAKRSVMVRDLPAVLAHLQRIIAGLAAPSTAVPVVAGRYLAPPVRRWLTDAGVSYVDATGNLRVMTNTPALYLRDTGSDRDPWRGRGRPRATLSGAPAAQVVRALVDHRPPYGVPEVVRIARASTGATYRVVELLEQEALIERNDRGRLTTVHWRRILERWSEDYGFQRSNTLGGYLQPRGLGPLLDDLRAQRDLVYVLTGSLAAERLAPYAPTRLAMLYAKDPANTADRLQLRAVTSGANVLVAAPTYDVVYERAVEHEGLSYVAPSQAAVDLLTAPGRGPSEAQALLDWMEAHESDWRV